MSAKIYSPLDFRTVKRITRKKSPNGHVCLALVKDDRKNDKLIVVKSLHQTLAEKVLTNDELKHSEKFISEAQNLRSLCDSNLRLNQFYGYALHKENKLAALLAWEFLPSLGPVIEVIDAAKNRQMNISFAVRSSWMRQLLKTMEYLHQQPVLHGNLKSKNVFIEDDCNIKLTDYSAPTWYDLRSIKHPSLCGRQDAVERRDETSHAREIPRTVEYFSTEFRRRIFKEYLPYMSLPRLRGESAPSDDIYSFGVVCWEISIGRYVDVNEILDLVLNAKVFPGENGETSSAVTGLISMLNGLFDSRVLPAETPEPIKQLFKDVGVGDLGGRISSNIQALASKYEEKFAYISARQDVDTEVDFLKNLRLVTKHMERVSQALTNYDDTICEKAAPGLRNLVAQNQENHNCTVQQQPVRQTVRQPVQSVHEQVPKESPFVSRGQNDLQPDENGREPFIILPSVPDMRPQQPSPRQPMTNEHSESNAQQRPMTFNHNTATTQHNYTTNGYSNNMPIVTVPPSVSIAPTNLKLPTVPKQTQPAVIELRRENANLQIIAQNIQAPTFIQNVGHLHIGPSMHYAPSNIAPEKSPTPPPPPPPTGVLSSSDLQVGDKEERLLRRRLLPIEKWSNLAKNLGLRDGDIEELRRKHENEGLAELNCRLIEHWTEMESTNATKKKLALALWNIGETDLSKNID